MKAPDFAYLRPESLEQALDALAAHGDDAAVLAGGQSLMVMLNLRTSHPQVLVDVNRVPGLGAIRDTGDTVAIGALCRWSDLEASAVVRAHLPLMAEALPHVAHAAIRSRGTIGGSLALGDPAAEIPACCLALGARVVAASPAGTREVAIEDWFLGLYDTALAPGELIVEVRVPKPQPGAVTRFVEHAPRHGDFAAAGVALAAIRGDGGVLHAPRVALLAAADRPLLACAVMDAIDGAAPAQIGDDALAAALARDADPPDDPAWPAAWRRHALRVLLRRALDSAA